MQSERTISTHEVINIHDTPFSKSVLAQPFHQALLLIAGLEMRRGQHFVLNDHQVLVSVQLLRYRQFWDYQAHWSLDQQKDSQKHSFVTFIDGLVLHWICKAFIIVGQVQRSIRYKSKLLILSIPMIILRTFIVISADGNPSHHNSIHYPCTFIHLLHKLLILRDLQGVALFLGHLHCLQHSFFQPGLPVLIHETGVAIDDGVETGFVNLEQVIGDGGWMDAVIAHYSFWQISE